MNVCKYIPIRIMIIMLCTVAEENNRITNKLQWIQD